MTAVFANCTHTNKHTHTHTLTYIPFGGLKGEEAVRGKVFYFTCNILFLKCEAI